MLLSLGDRATERKVRLFACACCRLIWPMIDDPSARSAVEEAERFADGFATQDQLAAAYRLAAPVITAANKAALTTSESPFTSSVAIDSITAARDAVSFSSADPESAFDVENGRQLNLLHCIFGNPFRPVTLDPNWKTSTVLALAQGIYDERAFERLPILADALQDAGCDNEEMLAHCRGDGPHARGCWVVDLVLGKQ